MIQKSMVTFGTLLNNISEPLAAVAVMTESPWEGVAAFGNELLLADDRQGFGEERVRAGVVVSFAALNSLVLEVGELGLVCVSEFRGLERRFDIVQRLLAGNGAGGERNGRHYDCERQ